MTIKALELKLVISGFFAAIGVFLGWKGTLLAVWTAAMVLDYISGSIAAIMAGEWSSTKAREGLTHKAGMILIVLMSMLFDVCCAVVAINVPVLHMTWPGVIFPIVLAWYIVTEAGSILENSIKMGAPAPAWLRKCLKAANDTIDRAGEAASEPEKEE